MTKTPGQQVPDPVALRSPRHLDFFDFMFTRFFAKHMRALRVARWGLPADYPMVAPNYAERRRELAVKIGLGRKPGAKRGRPAKAKA